MSVTSPPKVRTVRKRLEDDCLLRGELHPSVAERLARVRELPVQAVANLHGVERDEQGIWLVWQYIEGCNLDEYRAAGHSREEFARVIREVRIALAGMHSHGLVHGAVHERNIIVEPTGRVRLTHVSPLLYDDPRIDLAAVDRIAGPVVEETSAMSIDIQINQRQEEQLRRQAYIAAAVTSLVGIIIFVWMIWYIHA